ncbi:MAG: hypothetical protein KDE48_23620 [Anaerolineales bacterium]|nr:hypothetical protein [Anaerolineales bacterium]
MPSLTFENELPAPNEFEKFLSQAFANTNPVDDLLQLANQLWDFEQNHQMSSTSFYEKFEAGLLDEELQHCIEWAATYNLFIKTKRKVEATLMRAAIQSELFEPVP